MIQQEINDLKAAIVLLERVQVKLYKAGYYSYARLIKLYANEGLTLINKLQSGQIPQESQIATIFAYYRRGNELSDSLTLLEVDQ